MNSFDQMLDAGHEALHFFTDRETGLRALVAIHDTTLGPGLGGTRALSTYASESDAIYDVLRLARGMTYKAALAGIDFGGGKAVIWLPRGDFDREALFTSFARAVDTLGGRYITTEDAGTSTADVEVVRRVTKYVVGHTGPGGSGDPSPMTAYGVLRGIEAVARRVLGRSDLSGVRVNVQGVGNVGYELCRLLAEQGAVLTVADVDAGRVKRAVEQLGARPASIEEIVGLEADIFAPCALGAVINDRTLPQLKVAAVAGSANNQLTEPRHGVELAKRGIVYVPDYAINAGGLINVAQEWIGYDAAAARARTAKIYDTIDDLLARAARENRRPEEIADSMAEERISQRKASRQ